MKLRTSRNFRSTLVFLSAVMGACVAISPQLHAGEVQVGRYSTLRAMASVAQADLLSVIITVRFPEHIQTIGAALRYLMQRSGYRLADHRAANFVLADLLALPLPAVHRTLGPIPLSQALETLAGPVYHLVQDPVHRLVSFELCTVVGNTAHEADISLKTQDPHDAK